MTGYIIYKTGKGYWAGAQKLFTDKLIRAYVYGDVKQAQRAIQASSMLRNEPCKIYKVEMTQGEEV